MNSEIQHIKCKGCKCWRTQELFLSNSGRKLKCCSKCRNRFMCPVDGCISGFQKQSNLDAHNKSVHLKIKDVICPVDGCPYACSKQCDLNKHNKMIHLKIKDFVCPVDGCGIGFQKQSNLNRHNKMIHLKIKDFSCPVDGCNMTFSSQSNLDAHIKRIHLKIKDKICNVEGCIYTCSSQGDLDKHIKICTGKLNCSSGELAIMKILDILGIEYEFNQSHDNVRDKNLLRWDFKITYNGKIYFIEFDGKFHYVPIRKSKAMTQEQADENLKTTQKRDKIKNDYCENNNIPLLRIPYYEKDNIDALIKAFFGL